MLGRPLLGELAIAAARIGTYDWDLASGRADVGRPPPGPLRRAARCVAATARSTTSHDRVHPDDRDRVAAALDETVAT